MRQENNRVVLFFFSILFLSAFLSPNIGLTILSVITLAIIFFLLYRKGEPPILFFIVSFQWLQASIKVFYANLKGLPISLFQLNSDYHRAPGEYVETAIFLSLIAIIVLSLGIAIIVKPIPIINKGVLYKELDRIDVSKLITIYILVSVVLSGLQILASIIPQIRQLIVALLSLKWVVFFILAISIFYRNKKKTYFGIIIGLELIMGLTGIFSDFKYIFFYLILSYLTINYKFKKKTIVLLTLLGIIFFMISIIWTGVKGDYRNYMIGGKRGSWSIVTTKEENLKELLRLTNNFTKAQFDLAIEALIDRVSYVDYFAFSLKNVPSNLPFEGGTLWGNAISNILKPRMFFPDKKALDSDSEMTMMYTGLDLASKGASFSIGYIGESYIDFGKYFMFLPVFIVGIIYGIIYKYFVTKSENLFWGYAVSTAIILIAYRLEIATVKLVGMIGMSFLFYFLLKKVVEKRRFVRFFYKQKSVNS